MILTQFSLVAVGLRVFAGLTGAEQTSTCELHSTGLTGQGLTCDPEGQRELGERRRREERKGRRKRWSEAEGTTFFRQGRKISQKSKVS